MFINHNRKELLPNEAYLKRKYPLDNWGEKTVALFRNQIRNIFEWKDNRKILIIWPCSADFEDSLYEYAKFLAKIRDEVKDKILIVMRYYTEKPRTTTGWKWMVQNQWWIEDVRRIWINLINKYKLPLANELLYPHLLKYFDDIYTYLAIWARSTENQYHREISSWLHIPVWMKNPTSWDIKIMVNSIIAWRTPQTYTDTRHIYETKWNSFVHWVLRLWQNWPNYSVSHIQEAYDLMIKKGIKNPSLIIDTSHDNCKDKSWKKHPEWQIETLEKVIDWIKCSPELSEVVKWFMVESYLFDWKQDENVPDPVHWLSLTDPCIWKEETKELICEMYENLGWDIKI
jgi:3-deoxy-7-phosphoheptulonate synthase